MSCNLAHEDSLRARGLHFIAGIDEAGRGPLAGPVVAAAVILPAGFTHDVLNDSKQLTERRRERIYEELTARADIRIAFAIVEPEEIDRINQRLNSDNSLPSSEKREMKKEIERFENTEKAARETVARITSQSDSGSSLAHTALPITKDLVLPPTACQITEKNQGRGDATIQ